MVPLPACVVYMKRRTSPLLKKNVYPVRYDKTYVVSVQPGTRRAKAAKGQYRSLKPLVVTHSQTVTETPILCSLL